MRILLHICCAPCCIYPIEKLRKRFDTVFGYFYRHNIHPYTECIKREHAVISYAKSLPIEIIYQKGYELETFLRRIIFRESNRCLSCYHDRLLSSAIIAKKGNFNYFSSTLLYSIHQNHQMIKSIGESVSKVVNVPFYYDDFRVGWKEGLVESRRLKMYRQAYCGCIYSEKERYYK